jgi:hypothetical protein
VVVVSVILPVRVLVLDSIVSVAVVVNLGEVQIDTCREERGAHDCGHLHAALSQAPRGSGTNERRDRENRSGSTRAHAPLRQQI